MVDTTRHLDLVIRRTWPRPIALAWSHMAGLDDPLARRSAALDCGSVLLRVLGTLVLADRIARLGLDDVGTQAWVASLRKPADGHWSRLITSLVDEPESARGTLLPELAAWLERGGGSRPSGKSLLVRLVEGRNAGRHAEAGAGTDVAIRRGSAHESLLREIARDLRWLSDVQLVEVIDLPGSRKSLPTGRLRVLDGVEEPPETRRGLWRGEVAPGDVLLQRPGHDQALVLGALAGWSDATADARGELVWCTSIDDGRVELRATRSAERVARVPLADAPPRTVPVEWAPELLPDARPDEPLLADSDYDVHETLGAGGTGVVYRATDRRTGATVALKVIQRTVVDDPKVLARFEREARLLREVDHPNVLGVIDAGRLSTDVPYLAMPIAEGGTLAEQVRPGGAPARQVVEWVRQAAMGLAALHAAGVVHRDIKPSNLLLSGGIVRVSDLGLAQHSDDTRVTRSTDQLGTPVYMSPEQTRTPNVDGRSDVYSLAIVAHELLTGTPPDLDVGAGISGPLGAWIRRMGSPDASERPRAAEVAHAFGRRSLSTRERMSLVALVAVFAGVLAAFAVTARTGTALGFDPAQQQRLVTSGTSFQGSLETDLRRHTHEIAHTVTQTYPYVISTREVTRGEWRAVMGRVPESFDACGDACPVTHITWWDAAAFCNRLSERSGLRPCYELVGCSGRAGDGLVCEDVVIGDLLRCEGFRLPTEAEWERAARAGRDPDVTTEPRLADAAWFRANSEVSWANADECVVEGQTRSCGPQPVASREPNPWGIHDMLGNAAEWVHDWYGSYNERDLTDPIGVPSRTASRSVRGESYARAAPALRFPARSYLSPDERTSAIGFRWARTATPSVLPVDGVVTLAGDTETANIRVEPRLSAPRVAAAPNGSAARVTAEACGPAGYRWARVVVPPAGVDLASVDAATTARYATTRDEEGAALIDLSETGVVGWTVLYFVLEVPESDRCCGAARYVPGHGCCAPGATAAACVGR